MNFLRSFLHRHPQLHAAARGAVMTWRRWWRGLGGVHPSFHLAASSIVSRDLIAGPFSYIGPRCVVGPQVELGAYAMLGPSVSIVGGDHVFERAGVPIIFAGRPAMERTVIEADAWIGHGAILIAGVRIGRGAIVAAGAVVTRDVPPYEIHGGVPARKIRDRFATAAERVIHDRMLSEPPRRREFCAPLQLHQAA